MRRPVKRGKRRILLKFLVILVVLAAVAVVSYAYFGDMSPARSPTETPVTLEFD